MRAAFTLGLLSIAGCLSDNVAILTLATQPDDQPSDGSATSGEITHKQLESLHDSLIIANGWRAGACILKTIDGVTVDCVKSGNGDNVGNALITIRRDTSLPPLRLSLSLMQSDDLADLIGAYQLWSGNAEERDLHGV